MNATWRQAPHSETISSHKIFAVREQLSYTAIWCVFGVKCSHCILTQNPRDLYEANFLKAFKKGLENCNAI